MSPARTPVVLCVLALACAAVAPAAVTAQEQQVTLTVTVVDSDGDPVSNVAVSATWDDGAGGPVNETTRANGQVLLDVPEGADVTVRIDDDRYVRNHPFVAENASTRSVEVPISRSGRATLSVVDGDGDPVEDARVQFYTGGQFVTDQRTDADGTVTTPRIERGSYRVIVGKDGYLRNRTEVAVEGRTEATVRLVEGSALITVAVTDDRFDPPRPVRNATVRVPSVGTVQTLSDGEATIAVPVNDDYDLVVTKDGYERVERRVLVRETGTDVNVTVRRTPALTVTPDNRRVVVGETVRLRVTDEYGEPVANATVTRGGERVGTTDAAGVVVADVTAAGSLTFTATTDGLSGTATVEGVEAAAGTATETATDTATATATETATPTESESVLPGSGPGFGVVTALLALALAALLARRR
ncbi:Ig-like domain-containing protein [Haloarcula litorea]|uniref:Ig-like domain-containing protein n=1 Tax=Haloarcula litorea TaxID=3032579 RepID=UPI0023E804A1|nr:Ig-like domain-containing protein [Halomicroarcula sp. GDY20]